MKTNEFGGSSLSTESIDKAKFVILPVPYDGTSSWIKGADKGPAALLEASLHLEPYDIETNSEPYKKGIFTVNPIKELSSPEKMVDAVKTNVKELLKQNKFVITLGGEHSVSIGSILAYKEKYNNISKLQIDAHADLLDEYQGSKLNHNCVMARVKDICPFVQVGIRSMSKTETKDINKDKIFYAKDIYNSEDWIPKAIAQLTQDVYITIDLDALDPSIMPSTGTPEPGGLQYYPLLKFLKKVIETKNVVGFDIVELCPTDNKAPDYLAAKLLYKLIAYISFK